MFISYRQGAVSPFEDQHGLKQVFVTDDGTVFVRGEMEDEGWWTQTADTYDQGPAGVSMEELRARVATVRAAIKGSGLPHDNITALAIGIVGLDSVGWDGLDATAFHKGVAGLSAHVLANAERGTTTMYAPDGTRSVDVALAPPREVPR